MQKNLVTQINVQKLEKIKNIKLFYIKKNSECIKELEIDIPLIDFRECYEKVKANYATKNELIIVIIENYTLNNPKNSFSFYRPETGENQIQKKYAQMKV